MKKNPSSSLRSLLTEATPLRRLPAGVVRQLVGYYGDWRRSRDILNEADESSTSRLARLFARPSLSSTSSSYRAQ
ncbi:MAG: hypothetical protein ABI876_05095 [Bacteroidota bacterium]